MLQVFFLLNLCCKVVYLFFDKNNLNSFLSTTYFEHNRTLSNSEIQNAFFNKNLTISKFRIKFICWMFLVSKLQDQKNRKIVQNKNKSDEGVNIIFAPSIFAIYHDFLSNLNYVWIY
jgi:hypothetical protein